MKVKSLFVLLLLISHPCISRAEDVLAPVEGTNQLRHAWEYIYYPSLKYEDTNYLGFLVSPN